MNRYSHYLLCLSLGLFLSASGGASERQHNLENPSTGEGQLIAGLTENILSRIKTFRDAHPKAHGCVDDVDITVNPNLSPEHQVGAFSPGRSYKGVLRFSSGQSSPKANDQRPGPQGLALKIILDEDQRLRVPLIPGEKQFRDLSRGEYYQSFDIITINRLTEFMVNDLKSYPFFLEMVENIAAAEEAGTPEHIPGITAKYLGKIEDINVRKNVGRLLRESNSIQVKNLLHETYNSWVPSAFGEDRAVKYQIRPCDAVDPDSYQIPIDKLVEFYGQKDYVFEQDRNFISKVLHYELRKTVDNEKYGACFRLSIQLHEDGMPSVEDAALPWSDSGEARYVDVATIQVPRNSFLDPHVCEALAFNPAHALPEQRGIGSIQRARRLIYAAIETRRNENRQASNQK